MNGLILPIYYLDCDEIEDSNGSDIAEVLKSRQWSDWRTLRFHDIVGPEASAHLAKQALMIKRAVKEMNSFFSDASSTAIDELIERRQQDAYTAIKIESGVIVPPSSAEVVEVADPVTPELTGDVEPQYSIFTREFDEEIKVGRLINPIDVAELGKSSIKASQELRLKYGRRLRERLTPLSKVIGSDTALLILADNSGSLRGEPVSKLAAWSTVLLELLESLEVATAFVGFTTRSWKGGAVPREVAIGRSSTAAWPFG